MGVFCLIRWGHNGEETHNFVEDKEVWLQSDLVAYTCTKIFRVYFYKREEYLMKGCSRWYLKGFIDGIIG